jgi:hypothetical protein
MTVMDDLKRMWDRKNVGSRRRKAAALVDENGERKGKQQRNRNPDVKIIRPFRVMLNSETCRFCSI